MQRDRVLVLGGSFSALPIIVELKNCGFEIWLAGNNELEPGIEISDGYINVDYSDALATLEATKYLSYKYVIPSCNDAAYLTAAYIAENLQLSGLDSLYTSQLLHQKNKFRNALAESKFPTPKFVILTRDYIDQIQQIRFPALLKPTNLFSGIGIVKFESKDSLESYLESNFEIDFLEYVLEEYIPGELFSVSAFISNGKASKVFFADEFCTVYPYQVNCSFVPTSLSADIQNRIVFDINNLVHFFHLTDGLFHMQFISDNLNYWIIEIMRRCPGDLYGHMIQLSTNFNYYYAYIAGFLGLEIDHLSEFKRKFIARHTISTNHEGFYSSIVFRKEFKNLELIQLSNSGAFIREAPYGKIGIIFSEFENVDEMLSIVKNMSRYIEIKGVKV